MDTSVDTGHPIANPVFLLLAVFSGLSGEMLDTIDQVLGITLKFVSIVSFIIVIMINWKKWWGMVKGKKE